MTLMRGKFANFSIGEVLAVASLTRQNLTIALTLGGDPIGEIRVKAGRVMAARTSGGVDGLAAFRLLLESPGDGFAIVRFPPPDSYGEPLGTISALLAGTDPTVSQLDPTEVRFILTDVDEEEELDETFVFSDMSKLDLDNIDESFDFVMKTQTPAPASPRLSTAPEVELFDEDELTDPEVGTGRVLLEVTPVPAPGYRPNPELLAMMGRLEKAIERREVRGDNKSPSVDRALLVGAIVLQGSSLIVLLAILALLLAS